MSKSKKIRITVLSVLIALTVGFIWINSCFSKAVSSGESEGLFKLIKPIFDAIFGEGVITHGFFRKMAHFGEFGLLGIEINLLYIELFGENRKKIFQAVRLGLYVALIDETIQVLSSRGPAIVDIWIDFAGYVTATLLLHMIFGAIKSLKRQKQQADVVTKNCDSSLVDEQACDEVNKEITESDKENCDTKKQQV